MPTKIDSRPTMPAKNKGEMRVLTMEERKRLAGQRVERDRELEAHRRRFIQEEVLGPLGIEREGT